MAQKIPKKPYRKMSDNIQASRQHSSTQLDRGKNAAFREVENGFEKPRFWGL